MFGHGFYGLVHHEVRVGLKVFLFHVKEIVCVEVLVIVQQHIDVVLWLLNLLKSF